MPDDAVVTQTGEDLLADKVWGTEGSGQTQPQVESDEPPKPDAEPERKVESDDELPAVYEPEKYKTRAEEKKAWTERNKMLGDVDRTRSRLEALDSLERGLTDPNRQKSTIAEVLKQFNIDPRSLTDLVTTAEKRNAPFEAALQAVADDDFLEGRQVKTLLQGLVDHLKNEAVGAAKGELGVVLRALTPILSERREAELTAKFPLLKDPAIRARMDQIAAANDAERIGSDEVFMKAAAFDLIQEGKIPESLANEINQQIEALNIKKHKEAPEPGVSVGKTESKPLTQRDKDELVRDAVWGS